MEQLLIDGTKNSPRIELNPSGEIMIQGRCLVEDSLNFFNPVRNWIKSCTSKTIKIEFKVEYFNTSSLIQVFSLLTLILEKNTNENIEITWFYEQGDEDIFDLGKTMESQVNIPFNFVTYTNEI